MLSNQESNIVVLIKLLKFLYLFKISCLRSRLFFVPMLLCISLARTCILDILSALSCMKPLKVIIGVLFHLD